MKSQYFGAEVLIRGQGAQMDILHLYGTQPLNFLDVFSRFSLCLLQEIGHKQITGYECSPLSEA